MSQHRAIGQPRRRRSLATVGLGSVVGKGTGTTDYPSTEHFDIVVTDRVIEEPWVVSKVRPGERLLDVGSATSRYLRDLATGCRVCAIDLRSTRAQPDVTVLRGDLNCAPFRPGSFDVITCISTIEHVGLDIYDQGPDEFGDEVAMRHIRRLLRPGGRLLLTAPFGRAVVSAWHRVYNQAGFRHLIGGYRLLSLEYYRLEGNHYVPCQRDETSDASFDFPNMRSGGLVLAELTPADGLAFLLARLSLRIRRTWRQLTHRGPFWVDRWSGESAAVWLRRQRDMLSKRASR